MIDAAGRVSEAAERLAAEVQRAGLRVGVAESLTGGALTAALAKAPHASEWLRGGVVAYDPDVKHEVLGVPDVPIVSEPCATRLAEGVAELMRADLTLAATGVGGPEPQDGLEAGTVWTAIHHGGRTEARLLHLEGDPEAVLQQTCLALLTRAAELLQGP